MPSTGAQVYSHLASNEENSTISSYNQLEVNVQIDIVNSQTVPCVSRNDISNSPGLVDSSKNHYHKFYKKYSS